MQKILKAWTALAKTYNLSLPAKLVSVYIRNESKKEKFFVPRKGEEGFKTCEQLRHLLHGKCSVNTGIDVNIEVRTKPN